MHFELTKILSDNKAILGVLIGTLLLIFCTYPNYLFCIFTVTKIDKTVSLTLVP